MTFVNITDSIVFHINGTPPFDHHFIEFQHMTGGSSHRKPIFEIFQKTYISHLDDAFQGRVSVQRDYTSTEFTVSIENSTKNDSGYYMSYGERRCFTVYILGEYFNLYRIT